MVVEMWGMEVGGGDGTSGAVGRVVAGGRVEGAAEMGADGRGGGE